MNTVTPLDYVSVAVSEDLGRYNLNAAYREKDRLVGTDGHRLHMVSGLAMQAEGSFVDGRQGDFVNYEQVIPPSPTLIATFAFTKKQIAHLGKIAKLFSQRSKGCEITFANNRLKIRASEEASYTQGAWELNVEFDCTMPTTRSFVAWDVKINLGYFLEALIPDVTMSISASSGDGAHVLQADIDSCKYMAVIMPLRRD